MRTLVIIPTYNEAENVEPLLDDLRREVPAVDILIADDNSPDGTGKLAQEWADNDPQVHVLHRDAKAGLGAAYKAGFRWGLDRGYEVLVEMDADGSHRTADLPALLAAADAGADLAIGSRWVSHGAVENWPWHRKLISRGGTTYARLMLGLPVKDATAGFRAFRRTALEQIQLDRVASQGYCFQIDMTRLAVAAQLRVVEVPITFVERMRGKSKMSGAIVGEALWRVTAWGVAKRLAALRRLLRRA